MTPCDTMTRTATTLSRTLRGHCTRAVARPVRPMQLSPPPRRLLARHCRAAPPLDTGPGGGPSATVPRAQEQQLPRQEPLQQAQEQQQPEPHYDPLGLVPTEEEEGLAPSAPELVELLRLEALASVPRPFTPSAEEVLDILEWEADEVLALAPPTGPVEVLTCPNGRGGTATFYLLGTAHASLASVRDAGSLILAVRPEVVMVELCRERSPMLVRREGPQNVTLGEAVAGVSSGRVQPLAAMYAWLLSKVGRDLDAVPGGEFAAAAQAAQAVGAVVALGDRPMSITLARTWNALGFWEKARLLWSLLLTGIGRPAPERLRTEIEAIKRVEDVRTKAMDEFGKQFPSIIRPLLTEREEFMVYIMRHKLAPRWNTCVCVVGAGHLKGIKDKWEADIDFDEILRLPGEKQSRWHDVEAAEEVREREQAAAGAPGAEGNGSHSG